MSRREKAVGAHSSPTTFAEESGGTSACCDEVAGALDAAFPEAVETVVEAEPGPLDKLDCSWSWLDAGARLQSVKNATASIVAVIGRLTVGYPPSPSKLENCFLVAACQHGVIAIRLQKRRVARAAPFQPLFLEIGGCHKTSGPLF